MGAQLPADQQHTPSSGHFYPPPFLFYLIRGRHFSPALLDPSLSPPAKAICLWLWFCSLRPMLEKAAPEIDWPASQIMVLSLASSGH